MSGSTLKLIGAISCIVAIAIASPVRAEGEQPKKLVLHPMAAPTPALKYRLLPSAADLVSGNAAVPYGKVTAEEFTFFRKYAQSEKMDEWQQMPLDKIRREQIPLPEGSIFFLEQGSKCKHCDWQLPFGQMPFFRIMLPDAQQTRSYARILAVKARIETANGKFEDAVKSFQTSFALGTNVAKGETLVNGLIGIAIHGLTAEQITEYVQQPDAPNLYWALTILPTPLIDMQPALDIETHSIELSFPELRDLSSMERTADQWRDLFHHFAKQMFEVFALSPGDAKTPRPSEEDLDAACNKVLPIARRALIERGIPAKKVEAMATHQAALLYWLQLHRDLTDEFVKVYSLPYPQAVEGFHAANALVERAESEGGGLGPLMLSLMPVMEQTRSAVARGDRRIAALRVIEALRIYAASHDGKLPEQLSDVREVPIPNDPVTMKPFEYRRDGGKALLTGPTLKDVALSYEITMAPAK